jgi:hypothetical protein
MEEYQLMEQVGSGMGGNKVFKAKVLTGTPLSSFLFFSFPHHSFCSFDPDVQARIKTSLWP